MLRKRIAACSALGYCYASAFHSPRIYFIITIFYFIYLFFREGLTEWPLLAWNAQRSFCLYLCSAGIKGVLHFNRSRFLTCINSLAKLNIWQESSGRMILENSRFQFVLGVFVYFIVFCFILFSFFLRKLANSLNEQVFFHYLKRKYIAKLGLHHVRLIICVCLYFWLYFYNVK